VIENMIHKLDSVFAALADPTRRAIVARLCEGEATVNDLARPFPISQPAVSQHIAVLEQAGLILRRIDGQRRPCRLAPGALAPIQGFLADLAATFEANYARLDTLLARSHPSKD
jgi:DNA-binding transcriptional ArsR family regulator